MTDRPILFSGPMVRALLEGRKTQTRRVLKGLLPDDKPYVHEGEVQQSSPSMQFEDRRWPGTMSVGGRLWVREAWRTWAQYDPFSPRALEAGTHVAYEATPDIPNLGSNAGKYRPGMFMPRWASRLTLTVTDVRVQRLQEISAEDCQREGVDASTGDICRDGYMLAHRKYFRALWNKLNEARGFGWDANPWVAAYSFTVHRCNIDQMEAA